MKTSEKVDKILPALLKAKSNLGTITKDASNPFFKSKYADLNAHLSVIEPVLLENGLVLLQPVNVITNEFTGVASNQVESRILHAESGQFVSSEQALIGEVDMQKSGSAITYARRYTLGSLLSMQALDDDGEGSMTRGTRAAKSAAANKDSKTASAKPKSSGLRKPKAKPTTSSGAGLGDI